MASNEEDGKGGIGEKSVKSDDVLLRPPAFDLGRLVITANAMETLPQTDVLFGLARHERCDWGNLDPVDRIQNERGLVDGDRLLSVYRTANGTRFWIITEWDRSVTTVLLPEDY